MNRAFLVVPFAVVFLLSPARAVADRHYLLPGAFVHTSRLESSSDRPLAALRTRFVEPDLEALRFDGLRRGERRAAVREVMADLFADAFLPIALEGVERDGIDSTVWTGRVEGVPSSSVVLAIHGDAVTGLVTTDGRRFEIRPSLSGTHQVIETDPRGFPREDDGVMGTVTPMESFDAPVAGGDSGETIDVLVAYTSVVRSSYPSDDAVRSFISAAVATTNTAYERSLVNPRIRVAGTIELNYDDRTDTFSNALRRVTNKNDGFMDEVHAAREAVFADAVALIVSRPTDNLCGTAWIMGPTPTTAFERNAFSVTRDGCAVSNYSLAHEMGHNFGLQHDRANAGSGMPSYPYAYGYQDPEGRFRDIMSYDCPTGCPRLGYFSNPAVQFNGLPFGIDYLDSNGADNARALNANAIIIANWRKATPDPAPGPRRRGVRH